MPHASTIQLLRFPFSLFLLPVFLFAWVVAPDPDLSLLWQSGIILHLLVYPASNGYNSWMDQDTDSIGGVKVPMKPERELFWASVILDGVALIWSALISFPLFIGVLLYITMSRMYSYRGIRLKRFPILGFVTVFLMQGAGVFAMVYFAIQTSAHDIPWWGMLIASLLIGSMYPLTQVYQHKQDAADGVETLSLRLGVRGSFLFSASLFALATIGMCVFWYNQNHFAYAWLFLLCFFPAQVYFFYWLLKVWNQFKWADFNHSYRMNVIAGTCSVIYFIILLIHQHIGIH
jgi:1,4-dihydroxy-2-naphthoate polyprenyltransferase